MALSVTWLTERTCQAVFTGTIPTSDQLNNASLFSLQAQGGGSMTVYGATASSSAGATTLNVGPAVLPGHTYTIRFGSEVSTTEVPANILPQASTEWGHGVLETLTEAFGEAVQRFSGRPQTLVVSDYSPTDGSLFVESTLGFPNSGKLFVDGREYSYSAKTPMAFTGFASVNFSTRHLTEKDLVTCNVRAIFPD